MAILTPETESPVSGKSRRVLRNRVLGLPGLLTGSLCLVLCLLQPNRAFGQTVSREYPLKAVFLLNFSRFTEWPTNAFETPNSDFVIGILGKNPFGPVMGETVEDEKLSGRKYAVEYYENVSEVKKCNMLFISQSETGHLSGIVADLKDKPILTVSDSQEAAQMGVCVQFVTKENKIRLRINMDSLKSAHLTMSSELLRLADVISVATQ
jgi:hypothetical protein